MTRTYDIGYGQPPMRTRFKKGASGNPRGRPKGAHNLATDLQAELDEKISVREGGRQRRLSKQRVLLKALMAKAVQGDVKAAAALLSMATRLLTQTLEGPIELTTDDKLVLKRFAPLVLKSLAGVTNDKG